MALTESYQRRRPAEICRRSHRRGVLNSNHESASDFTFLDCLIVLIIVVSAGYAAWRGFLWETLTIFAWVAAAFASLYFGPYIIPLTRSLVHQAWLASLVGLCRGVPGGVHSASPS